MDRAAIEGSVSIAMIEMPGIAELQIWVYIKKNKLNKGRTITPDAKLKKVLPAASSAGCAFRTDRIL